MKWIDAVARLAAQNRGFVLVTVVAVQGSAPRAVQAKMVVDADNIYDSIGGGNLEYRAMQHARTRLSENTPGVEVCSYTLGKDLTQCCGGKVELLYECFPACDFHIALFGAGHVGEALVSILAELPCRVTWFDSRRDLLERAVNNAQAPANVAPQVLTNPYEAAEQCPARTFYLVMTHSHEQDFELCEAILARADLAFCGLIGSKSKAAKFRQRLNKKQYTPAELDRLTCPIGLDLGRGKQPMQVAVAVAAQLMQISG